MSDATETIAPPVDNGEVKPTLKVKRNWTQLPATPSSHFATVADWHAHYFLPTITKKEVVK
jgi:hypothetical protein